LASEVEHDLEQAAAVAGHPLRGDGDARRQRLEEQAQLLFPRGAVGHHRAGDSGLLRVGRASTRSLGAEDARGTLWASPACTSTGFLRRDSCGMRTLLPR